MPVRPITVADVPAVMALERESPAASHWSPQHYEDLFREPDVRRLVLVIEDQNRILGFVAARSVETDCEIENIVVSAPSRKQGLGTQLVSELLNLVQDEGAAAAFLEVRESNRPARAFYEKLRFTESGRRPRYYRQPEEDAITYRRALK